VTSPFFRKRPLTAAAALLTTGAVAASWLGPAKLQVRFDRDAVYADGRSVVRAEAMWMNVWGQPASLQPDIDVVVDDLPAGATTSHREGTQVWLKVGTRPGTLRVVAKSSTATTVATLQAAVDASDVDDDGLPDVAELMNEADRVAFTTWFTRIAESQAIAIDDAWPAVHQDCAGLIRFAAKEALRRHDRSWLQNRRVLLPGPDVDVSAFAYPDLPVVGDRLFVAPSTLPSGEKNPDAFTAAPSAQTLWQHNTTFVSRDVDDAKAGDLLFFKVPYASGSRMHSMVALGARSGASLRDRASRVVYHTGAAPDEGGEVRVVDVDELLRHPSMGWRPVKDNPRFLGVHRLHHLTHDARRAPQFRFAASAKGGHAS